MNSLDYQINLLFEADTDRAKREITDLNKTMAKLRFNDITESSLGDVSKAKKDVTELASIMRRATDESGKIDFSKVAFGLNETGKRLRDYKKSFATLGAEGQAAFKKISYAILGAERPMIRVKGMLDKFINQMIRTTSIQLSYTILNTLVDGLHDAVHYSKQLNKSLTDIQIVSKESTTQMKEFAKYANESAKSLHVNTLAYTDAALIYYQQGLSDDEVRKRTDTTLKMSNVSGESAEDVSSYMTAIWNNFADGSRELEYYADVISKLGADTAASNAQIAEGMQAFAAVADTVGLSYEYATSALALLVDKTQQSANVIGTSLKTIFARLESVMLGDTLEDGTNLTKYTKELAKVGIDIREENGDLMAMDDILDKLGDKWQELNEQQKMGVAYAVAGVRQYNNFISLMDNYEAFQGLTESAKAATGELNKQQDIYTKSWEAANKKVAASAQSIYQNLIDDQFFIDIINGFASVLDIINNIVVGLGGMKGMLLLIGSIGVTIFGQHFVNALSKAKEEFLNFTFSGRRSMKNLEIDAEKGAGVDAPINVSNLKDSGNATVSFLYSKYQQNKGALNEVAQDNLEQSLRDLNVHLEQTVHSANEYENARTRVYEDKANISKNFGKIEGEPLQLDAGITNGEELSAVVEKAIFKSGEEPSELTKQVMAMYEKGPLIGTQEEMFNKLFTVDGKGKKVSRIGIKANEDLIKQALRAGGHNDEEVKKEFDAMTNGTGDYKNAFSMKESKEVKFIIDYIKSWHTASMSEIEKIDNEEVKKAITAEKQYKQLKEDTEDRIEKRKQAEKDVKDFNEHADDVQNQTPGAKEGMNQKEATRTLAGSMLGLVGSLVALDSTVKILFSKTSTGEEKLASVASSLITIIPLLVSLAHKKGTGRQALGFFGEKMTNYSRVNGGAPGKAAGFLGKMLASGPTILITITAITAALGALAWTLKKLKDLSPEGQLKKVNENLKENENALNSVKEELNQVTSKLNSLRDSYESINKMTVGSYEWSDAIRNVNLEMADLIEKYDLIEGEDFLIDSNGMYRTTESGEDKIKKINEEKLDNLALGKANLLRREQELEREINKEKAVKNLAHYRNSKSEAERELGEENFAINKLSNAISSGKFSFETFLSSDEKDNKWLAKMTGLTEEGVSGLRDGANSNKNLRAAIEYNTLSLKDNSASIKAITMPKIAQVLGDRREELEDAGIDMNQLSAGASEELENRITKAQAETNHNNVDKESMLRYGVEQLGWEKEYEGGKVVYIGKDGNKKTASDIDKKVVSDFIVAERVTNDFMNELSGASTDDLKDIETKGSTIMSKEGILNKAEMGKNALSSKDLDQKELRIYTDQLKNNSKALEENAKAAEQMAAETMYFNDGLSDLIKNYEEYNEAIASGNKNSEEYAMAMNGIKESLHKMFRVDSSEISDDFVEDHMNLIKNAITGDDLAMMNLFKSTVTQVVEQMGLVEEKEKDILNFLNTFSFEKLEAGMTWEDLDIPMQELLQKFINTCDGMIREGVATTEEINKIFDDMGFEIKYKYVAVEGGRYVQDGSEDDYREATENDTGTRYDAQIDLDSLLFNNSLDKMISNSNRKASQDLAREQEKKLKQLDDEIERYHVIKKELAALESQLSKISKAKDRAFGNRKIALMDQEIAKYEDLANSQRKYLEEIKSYLAEDQAVMAGYGAQFGADGTIINYEELMRNAVNAYNSAADDEAAGEAYENFKKALSKYEESVSLMQSEDAKLQDYLNSIYDAKLDKLKYKIEIELDIEEDDIKYLDFLMQTLEDDTYDVAEAMGYLTQQTQDYFDKLGHVKDGIAGLFDNHGADGQSILAQLLNGDADVVGLANKYEFTTAEVEQLRQWIDNLSEWTLKLKELQKEINQKVIDSFDNFISKIEEQTNKVEHLNNVLSSYKNIIGLVGKETLKISEDLYNRLNDNVMDMANRQLEISRVEYETAKRAYDEAVAKGLDQDVLDELETKLGEVQESYLSNWEKAIQLSQDLLKESLKDISDKFGKAVSGMAGSLENLQDAFDKRKALDSNYLQTYERIYQLTKLTKDITNSIDDTDDIAGKQRLKELMEEINQLQKDDTKLSEYQVNVLRKRYELYQAEIALRDAENAKSQVRMVGDAEGNVNYMYTADQEAIDQAEGDYYTKLYEYADLNANRIDEINQRLLENRRQLAEELANCDQNDKERMDEIMAYYEEQERYLEEQMQAALDANVEVNGYKEASDWDVATNFKDTAFSQITGYETLEEVQQNWKDSTEQMAEEVADAFETYQTRYEAAMEAAGVATDNFANKVEQDLGKVEQESDKAGQKAEEMSKDFENAFTRVVDAANQFSNLYADAINSAIKNNGMLIESMNDLIRALAKVNGTGVSLAEVKQQANAAGSKGKMNLTDQIKNAGNGSSSDDFSGYEYHNKRYASLSAAMMARENYADLVVNSSPDALNAGSIQKIREEILNKMDIFEYKNGKKVDSFDTGGYTGEWGTYGKLALLHEKEMVLNQEDTHNILATVNVVRDMLSNMRGFESLIDLNTTNSGLSSINTHTNQNITIQAEFPNATDHSEIEEAFNNLLNRASQYANKK